MSDIMSDFLITVADPSFLEDVMAIENSSFSLPWSRQIIEYCFSNYPNRVTVALLDGKVVGATLDRNGLRPARYYVTDDNRLILASEVGVLDIDLPDVHCFSQEEIKFYEGFAKKIADLLH